MGFDELNAMQKKLSSLQSTVYEKNLELPAKMVKNRKIWSKVTIFDVLFLIFSEMVLCRELGFLGCIQYIKTILLSYQN